MHHGYPDIRYMGGKEWKTDSLDMAYWQSLSGVFKIVKIMLKELYNLLVCNTNKLLMGFMITI